MSQFSQWYWYISRGTGVVSMALLTLVLVLGMVLRVRRRPQGQSQTVAMGMHRWLGLGSVVFLLLHIVTAILDSYVDIPWVSMVLPFTSGYETAWVGLGTLAIDILLAVVVTSLLRHRLPEHVWRAVHWLAYAFWPIALVHGYAMGTAADWQLRLVTVACAVVGLTAAAWRVLYRNHDAQRRLEILREEWA